MWKKIMKKISASFVVASSSQLAVPQNPKPSADLLSLEACPARKALVKKPLESKTTVLYYHQSIEVFISLTKLSEISMGNFRLSSLMAPRKPSSLLLMQMEVCRSYRDLMLKNTLLCLITQKW